MKKFLMICMMSFLGIHLSAQNSIVELFKTMPDSLMPMLTKNNRLDMVDFLDANMKAEVSNLLDGDSEMTYMSADSLSVRLSSALRVDLFLVDTEEPYDSCQQAVCMLSTYKLSTTGEEEQVPLYYSVRWQPLSVPRLAVVKNSVSTVLRQDEEVFSKE